MDPTVVAASIAAGVSVLTLAGTLGAQYLSYRAVSRDAGKAAEKAAVEQRAQLDRTLAEQNHQLDRTLKEERQHLDRTLAEQGVQLDRTLAEQRTRTLNERFATAADQLGSDKPAVRLAGIHAMAGLADDWEASRQTCIDVLCAYLQLPYEPDPGGDAPVQQRVAFKASQKVRHTVIQVIAAHLREEAATSWQGLSFDFRGVVFDGGDFRHARFTSGVVNFSGAEFSAGTVSFDFAKFSGGTVFFRHAKFSGANVDFYRAHFSGDGVGTVSFNFAKFSASTVGFGSALFTAPAVESVLLPAPAVEFVGAEFSGGEVNFGFAGFLGGRVTFQSARFLGGIVDFSEVSKWSVPPAFPRTGTLPSSVKLPPRAGTAAADR
jgi:hypothetical protein